MHHTHPLHTVVNFVLLASNFHLSGNTILRADAKTRTRRFAEVLAHSTACLLRMDIAYLLNRSNPTYQSPLRTEDLHQDTQFQTYKFTSDAGRIIMCVGEQKLMKLCQLDAIDCQFDAVERHQISVTK
jgi:hypothetical protein